MISTRKKVVILMPDFSTQQDISLSLTGIKQIFSEDEYEIIVVCNTPVTQEVDSEDVNIVEEKNLENALTEWDEYYVDVTKVKNRSVSLDLMFSVFDVIMKKLKNAGRNGGLTFFRQKNDPNDSSKTIAHTYTTI